MFMALDPSVFVNDFPTRLNGLMSDLRNLEPVSFHIPYHILIYSGFSDVRTTIYHEYLR